VIWVQNLLFGEKKKKKVGLRNGILIVNGNINLWFLYVLKLLKRHPRLLNYLLRNDIRPPYDTIIDHFYFFLFC